MGTAIDVDMQDLTGQGQACIVYFMMLPRKAHLLVAYNHKASLTELLIHSIMTLCSPS